MTSNRTSVSLSSPLVINGMKLKNRLVMPPMATAKANADGTVSPELLEYYAEKSAGGHIGLIIVEHAYVSREGKAGAGQLSAASDADIPGLRRLAETIQKNGTKAVLQINHAGSAAEKEVIGVAPAGPSTVKNPRKGDLPREMTAKEISELTIAFQQAARRAQKAGFDGVEVHSAHGYLLNQFYSPLTNKRKDAYGGALPGRIRVHLEIISALRKQAGPEYPLFLRLGAADYIPGGTVLAHSVEAAAILEAAGVDALDISGGFCGYNPPDRQNTEHENIEIPEQGYFAPLTEAIKGAVRIPVILTGGITEAGAAEKLLQTGRADLIGVGRVILNDSHWARRAFQHL